jgi:hypothetical protein
MSSIRFSLSTYLRERTAGLSVVQALGYPRETLHEMKGRSIVYAKAALEDETVTETQVRDNKTRSAV